jgi:hypothetical protein
MRSVAPERVLFLGLESGDDIIVSFAIAQAEPGEVISLILHRSKYEVFLPPDEQGVHVSHEAYEEEERELLRRVAWAPAEVSVESSVRSYLLDISTVDASEVQEAKRLLKRMNRDGCFDLSLL